MGRRLALLIATYDYQDDGLKALTAPAHDAKALAAVLSDPDIAGFDVLALINEPHHVVGEAVGELFRGRERDDLTLLYFTGHGVKDEDGLLYLAMANTRRDNLIFTSLAAEQIDQAMSASRSRQQVLVLDCCYSGAFPAGRLAKSDTTVHTLARFQGRGRSVITASDALQYAFEGRQVRGQATQSVFTRHFVEGLREGSADLDGDGDITLDELYHYVHDRVTDEVPQQRPKKLDSVEGRIVIARNVHWTMPDHLRSALGSPMAADRLRAVDGLVWLHRVGNDQVRSRVVTELRLLTDDDSRSVSAAAVAQLQVVQGGERPGSTHAAEAARVTQGAPSAPLSLESGRSPESPTEPPRTPVTQSNVRSKRIGASARLRAFVRVRLATLASWGNRLPGHCLAVLIACRPVRRRVVLSTAVTLMAVLAVPGGWLVGDRPTIPWDHSYAPLTGHDGSVESVTFSPDGDVLASSGEDGKVRLWDADTHQLRGTLAHRDSYGDLPDIPSVAFSPNGKIIAVAESHAVRLWDVRKQKPLGNTMAGHDNPVESVAFSPDGKTLASGSWDGKVRLWNVDTQSPQGDPLTGHGNIKTLTFSPNGETLLVAGSNDYSAKSSVPVRLWNVATRSERSPDESVVEDVESVAFTPDSRSFATGGAGWSDPLLVWDVGTLAPDDPLTVPTATINSVAISPDGKILASGGADDTVRLWDLTTRSIYDNAAAPLGNPLTGHTDTIMSVAFSPDGKTLASGALDGTIRLWHVESPANDL